MLHTTHSYYHNLSRFHATSMQLHNLLTKHLHKCSPEWLAFVNKVLNKMGNNTVRQFVPSGKVLGWCFGSPSASEVLLYYIDTI